MSQQPVSFDNTLRELFEYPDPSFPVIVWTGDFRTLTDRCIVCHWHSEFEYGVLLSGELDFFIDGRHIFAKKGDAVFINADTMHMASQTGDDGVVLFTVSFLPSLFTGGNDGTMFRKYFLPVLQCAVKGFFIDGSESDGGDIISLLHGIYRLDTVRGDDFELECLSLVSRLWGLTLRYIKTHENEFASFRIDRGSEEKAKDILSYLHTHYAEDITVEKIARQTGISRSECFRCFGRYTGKKPIEHLTEYRLAHAANLLYGTNKPIAQIAAECGFSNSSYFGKVFKKKYAVSPARFKSSLVSHEKDAEN